MIFFFFFEAEPGLLNQCSREPSAESSILGQHSKSICIILKKPSRHSFDYVITAVDCACDCNEKAVFGARYFVLQRA